MNARVADIIEKYHYTHSMPSGKSWYFSYEDVVVVYSIPANPYLSTFLVGEPNVVIELSRLWAPDGHRPNLMTQAISASIKWLKPQTPTIKALIAYADPNVGHSGGVYRAASWVYLGQSEEGRYYQNAEGQVVARRKFHAGNIHLKKADIEARGYRELKRPGKHRYAFGLTRDARRKLNTKKGAA